MGVGVRDAVCHVPPCPKVMSRQNNDNNKSLFHEKGSHWRTKKVSCLGNINMQKSIMSRNAKNKRSILGNIKICVLEMLRTHCQTRHFRHNITWALQTYVTNPHSPTISYTKEGLIPLHFLMRFVSHGVCRSPLCNDLLTVSVLFVSFELWWVSRVPTVWSRNYRCVIYVHRMFICCLL